jgi:saccharopepsin
MRGRSSRSVPRPAAPAGTLAARAAAAAARVAPAAATGQILKVPLVNGPYQNNGASQWYANVDLGTPGQPLKFAFDTGSNFIWTTSSLCSSHSCKHYGGGRFVYQDSSTFQWIDQNKQKVDFGPWGSMIVETGQDIFAITAGASLDLATFLSEEYHGSQFDQLDWDGGIGIPSGTIDADPSVSFIIPQLMNAGLMDPQLPYVSFSTDQATNQGSVFFGGVDLGAIDPYSGVFLPWTPYTALSGVTYIWSTPLYQYIVGTEVVAANKQFALDSGSSQFKGDDAIMDATLKLVAATPQPDVTLVLGVTPDGYPASVVVPPDVYMVDIQAGPDQGQTLPQFNPLGLTGLVLVGSVLMDQLYTVYEYDVTETDTGYYLAPIGMWIFNKQGGPPLIKTASKTAFAPRPRRPHAL